MKTIQGTITSLKTTNTARVRVVRKWQHPLYKKFVKRTTNFLCHYTDLKLAEGDEVEIQECAPISKMKRFIVINKVASAKQSPLSTQESAPAEQDGVAMHSTTSAAKRTSTQKGEKV